MITTAWPFDQLSGGAHNAANKYAEFTTCTPTTQRQVLRGSAFEGSDPPMPVILITPSYGTPFTTWLTFMDKTWASAMVHKRKGSFFLECCGKLREVKTVEPLRSVPVKTNNLSNHYKAAKCDGGSPTIPGLCTVTAIF